MLSSAASDPSTSQNGSSSMGCESSAIRSFTRDRLGLVYVPTRSPMAPKSAVTMAAVEPLPLVPVTCTEG